MFHSSSGDNQMLQIVRAGHIDSGIVYWVSQYVCVCLCARIVAVLSNILRIGHDELLQVLFDNVYDIQGKKRIIIIRIYLLFL